TGHRYSQWRHRRQSEHRSRCNLATDRQHPDASGISVCTLHPERQGRMTTVFGTGDIPEVAMTSTTAPGITHRWTNMASFADEVANARVWAGFHYRFSTRVGTNMGRRIGEHVVNSVMQPIIATGSR